MYPSKPNTNGESSAKDSDISKSTAPYPTSSEKQGAPPTEYGDQSSNPSAPLLPSSPYNPAAPSNLEPPPYSSVVGQDSNDWKNRSSSFSAGNNLRPYPPAAPHISGSKSTSGLDSQAPYPSGPGPTSQAPYPSGPGPTSQAPYQTGGYSSYGPPAQTPYPPNPEKAGTAPYPSGPGLGSGITSQPPYSTSSGYMPGPASQAPYPVGAMPMPAPVDTNRQIGFTAPVTIEPKSYPGYQTGGYSQGPNVIQQPGMQQQGLIYPVQSGENNQYIQSQYVPNQYGQQQQPNTIVVVQKTPERDDSVDDCCLMACCLASCYCLCECIKCCVSDS